MGWQRRRPPLACMLNCLEYTSTESLGLALRHTWAWAWLSCGHWGATCRRSRIQKAITWSAIRLAAARPLAVACDRQRHLCGQLGPEQSWVGGKGSSTRFSLASADRMQAARQWPKTTDCRTPRPAGVNTSLAPKSRPGTCTPWRNTAVRHVPRTSEAVRRDCTLVWELQRWFA